MIKIKLIVPKHLSNEKDLKENSQVLNLEYTNPVTVERVLKENKIKLDYLGFIVMNGDKNIKKDFLIEESCELKLFLVMGGG